MNIICVRKIVLSGLLTLFLLITINITAFAASNNIWFKGIPTKVASITNCSSINSNYSNFSISTYQSENNTKIDNSFFLIKTLANSNVNQESNLALINSTNRVDLSANIGTIKIAAGVVILVLTIISVLAFLNLDKNHFKDYFK